MRRVGAYELLEEVGHGGMAIVYRARHAESREIVAVKELTNLAALGAMAKSRLLRSTRLVGTLSHPNVVAVEDVFEHDGTLYLAMEYLERGSLRPWLPTLTPAQLAGVFEDVLRGLAGLARQGIVHRDLKPENLLISASGTVKIADVALAKSVEESGEDALTPVGSAVGTPSYIAPEQAAAGPVDPRTDLYAAGCVAYEALVGHVPFSDSESQFALLIRRVNEDVPAPASVDPSIGPELSGWVSRLLARDPARRTESAEAAWRELEAIILSLEGPAWRERAALPSAPPQAGDVCPECGATNSAESAFCARCGSYLRWETTDRFVVPAAEPVDTPMPAASIPPPVAAYETPPPMPAPPMPAPAMPAPPMPAPPMPAPQPIATRLVRRTPHLDLTSPSPLTVGCVFEVTVYVDESAARAGEEIEELRIKAPSAVEVLELDVWLVATHHFLITDAPIRRITLAVDEPRSTGASFRVAVVAAPSEGEEPVITASLSCFGRSSGRVSRAVPIAATSGAALVPEPAADPDTAPAIEVDLTTLLPDITIEIAAPENDGRRFEVRIDAPLLSLDRRTETWFLPVEAGEMVTGAMERFFDRDASPRARMSSLRGAGLEFFDAAPQLFKDVYWGLVDAGRRPRSLFLVSDERNVPWELMIPSRRGAQGTEEHEPLGVQMAIGRWHRQSGVSPRQRIPLSSSVVVAPQYSSTARLEHAAAEAEFVCRNFGGSRVEPASFDNLDVELERRGADLLHFVCHGEADEREQILLLEEPDKLYAQQIRAMPGLAKACRERKPLVFLNACELGREGRGLAAASSFAKSFIEVDAACVIGTLWSVDDETAHAVAIEFYERVLSEPGIPFAEALRRIRARGYEAPGEDSWAAYCFYGDPAARRD